MNLLQSHTNKQSKRLRSLQGTSKSFQQMHLWAKSCIPSFSYLALHISLYAFSNTLTVVKCVHSRYQCEQTEAPAIFVGNKKSHKSPRMEEKSNFFRVVCKLSYGPCVLLSPVIVFKLNFNLLVCLRGKMKSNLLITHIHTHSKYKYWIVHIAEGAKKCLGPAAQTEEEKTKDEMIKPRLRRKM